MEAKSNLKMRCVLERVFSFPHINGFETMISIHEGKSNTNNIELTGHVVFMQVNLHVTVVEIVVVVEKKVRNRDNVNHLVCNEVAQKMKQEHRDESRNSILNL